MDTKKGYRPRCLHNQYRILVQADAQVTSEDDVKAYGRFLQDIKEYVQPYSGKRDISISHVMVADSTINGKVQSRYGINVRWIQRRGIAHDVSFESYFGPIYYSFNKGKAHYIVLDNCFYVNRDYQYIGLYSAAVFTVSS